MPDGKVVQVIGKRIYRLNPSTWTWSNLKPLPGGNGPGSAGLMLPGGPQDSNRLLMIGGLTSTASVRTTERYDYADPAAGWSYGNPLPTRRSHMNVVQVPDGSAYGIGGNGIKLFEEPRAQALGYNVANDTWTNLAVQTPRRAYHSTAILLPDARILSAGDDGPGGGRQLIDIYSPPYLFKGPRPVIAAAPIQIDHSSSFSVSTRSPTGFSATAPRARVAPPGYYMLFALNLAGVPSVARWVHVGP